MRQLQLPSKDGVHKLHVVLWETTQKPRAVLQISHGMVEFIERYDDFAAYLNQNGIAVIGNDHLGHGHTAKKEEEYGYFCPQNMSETVVADLHSVTQYAKECYPKVPFFLLGHSMGSFMARRYCMTYPEELTGAIISGTGSQPKAVITMGKAVCGLLKLVKGEHYRSEFVRKTSFGSFNKRIQPRRTENDWLTKDEAIVDWYNANKLCTFHFTLNGYQTLFDVLTFIQKRENIDKIPNTLPMYMIAGQEDPVGAYGKGVKAIYQKYRDKGMEDITLKLYPEDRHEILNELDREQVYQDILHWVEQHV